MAESKKGKAPAMYAPAAKRPKTEERVPASKLRALRVWSMAELSDVRLYIDVQSSNAESDEDVEIEYGPFEFDDSWRVECKAGPVIKLGGRARLQVAVARAREAKDKAFDYSMLVAVPASLNGSTAALRGITRSGATFVATLQVAQEGCARVTGLELVFPKMND